MLRNAVAVLGIVGLFGAIVIGMLATLGAFGSKAPVEPYIAAEPEAATETTNQRAEQAASVGETVRAGDLSWTVTAAYPKEEISTYTFPPEHTPGNYVHMEFTVENVSERPVTLSDDTISVSDAGGREYLPEADRNSAYVRHEYNILFNELGLLQPGESKEGKVNVGVLPNASDFVARLGDTDPTAEEEEYVELGF